LGLNDLSAVLFSFQARANDTPGDFERTLATIASPCGFEATEFAQPDNPVSRRALAPPIDGHHRSLRADDKPFSKADV
jgi:hypothetical protein